MSDAERLAQLEVKLWVIQRLHQPTRFLWWQTCQECRQSWPCLTARVVVVEGQRPID